MSDTTKDSLPSDEGTSKESAADADKLPEQKAAQPSDDDKAADKDDDGIKADDKDWRAEFERLKAQHDDILSVRDKERKKRQEAERELENARQEADRKAQEREEADKDIEALKARFSKKETEYEQKLRELEHVFGQEAKEARILRLVGSQLREEAVEDFMTIVRDKIVVKLDPKEKQLVWETADGTEVEEFLSSALEKRPHMRKATRVPGVGDGGGPDKGNKSESDVVQRVAKSSDFGKSEFKQDPDAAREFLKRASPLLPKR